MTSDKSVRQMGQKGTGQKGRTKGQKGTYIICQLFEQEIFVLLSCILLKKRKGKYMKKIKQYSCFFFCIIFAFTILNGSIVYAASEITATAIVDGRNVTITGQVPNNGTERPVTLLVGEEDNILYVDQIKSDTSGAFSLSFALPVGLAAGNYRYRIGGVAGIAAFEGTIVYGSSVPVSTRAFMEADINIALSAYVPNVSGTISCIPGKEVVFSVVNVTDNTVIKSETIKAIDGIYELSCSLPSLLASKTYTMSAVCNDENGCLASIVAEIDSEIYKVTASGTVTTANDVTVDISATSTNTDLIDKSTTISGNFSKSLSIPNLIPTAAFEVSMVGYEEYGSGTETAICSVTGIAGDTLNVVAKGQNIASFENRTFVFEYDPQQLEIADLFGFSAAASLEVGSEGNVEIVSYTPGSITFKVNNITVPTGKVWSGVLNLFKVKFTPDHTGGSILSIRSKKA